MNRHPLDVWTDAGGTRYFLIPDGHSLANGSFAISTRAGQRQTVDPEALAPFEVSEAQAVRAARYELGETLTELRGAIDRKLAEWRQWVDERSGASSEGDR